MLQWTQWTMIPQYSEREKLCYRCRERSTIKCSDGKHLCIFCRKELNLMPSIKITAEVDGKQVPLDNISTETFETIKALEKPKEIPIARLAINRSGDPRLLFQPTEHIVLKPGQIYALSLRLGVCSNVWPPMNDKTETETYYENIKPL